MKRLFIKMLTVILCVACLGQFAFQAFAASSDVKYVKEVYLSYGRDAESAKKWLTDHGYEVFDQDLNAGANDAFPDVRAVFLGYKTTDD
ncbi:MAG: hypothetical protein KBT31_01675, partial [Firmicutes bacterium]|nr:hypothetical protein [Candidatus Colimorpha enterica]